MKTCGTCKHWNFKVSSDKAWGQCLGTKARKAFYVSVKIPDDIDDINDLYQFRARAQRYTEVYFEENDFGCIHHERLK